MPKKTVTTKKEAKTTTSKKSTTKKTSTVKKSPSKKNYKLKKSYIAKHAKKDIINNPQETNNKIDEFTKIEETTIEEEKDEEIIPYKEELSTIEENPIPYNDELSTVEEIPIPYDDKLSTVEEIPIPYNDELSTIEEEKLEEIIDYYNGEVKEEKINPVEELLEVDEEDEKTVDGSLDIDNKKRENKQSRNLSTGEKSSPTSAFIVTGIILTIGLSIMVIYLLYKAFSVGDIENIRYKENSKITYNLNKKDEEIDTITLNTEYTYNTNTESSLEFTYYYLAKITILNSETNEELYSSSYKLSNPIKKEMINKNDYTLSNTIEVDYKKYLEKVNKMVSKYENAESYLDVYLMIDVNNINKNEYNLSLERTPHIRFNLSSEELNSEIVNVDTEERVFNRPKVLINKPMRLIEGVLLAFLTMIVLIYTIQLVYDNKKE